MGSGYMADTRHDYFITTQLWYDSGPVQDSSWTVFGLVYKPIGQHKHNIFTVGPFCPMLGIDSPSDQA
jgi:hypothetical protein